MSSHTTHDRLRAQARSMPDPADRALLDRLADLQELDARRRELPAGSRERDEIDDRIAQGAARILHDPDVG